MTHPIHPVPPRLSILRRREVEARTGLSRSSIYLRITSRTFPSPISLGSGARAVGWLEQEIEDWLQQQVAASRKAIGRQLPRGERETLSAIGSGVTNLLADGESAKTA